MNEKYATHERTVPLKLGLPKTRLRILLLRTSLLYPADSGEKTRAAALLYELAQDHDIIMVAQRHPDVSREDIQMTEQHCRALYTVPLPARASGWRGWWPQARHLLGGLPDSIAQHASAAWAQQVAQVYAAERPDVVLCDSLQACEGLRAIDRVPFIVFQQRAEAAMLAEDAECMPTFWQRAWQRYQTRRLREYERRMCGDAGRVVVVSDTVRRRLEAGYGGLRCHVLPVGIDTELFAPPARQSRANNLVFAGSLDRPANQDAVKHFAREIFPQIREEVRDVVLSIVGRKAPRDIAQLGDMPGIHVISNVNDARPYIQGARVYVEPLRVPRGPRMRLLEALAMGKAAVTSSAGIEGLAVKHRESVVVADEPGIFAAEIVDLLRNGHRRMEIGRNARLAIERGHAWRRVAEQFGEICFQVATEATPKNQRALA